MHFGVIYDVDIIGYPFEPKRASMSDFDPKSLKQRGVWQRTERGPHTNYGEDIPVAAHGKWVALLTKEQMREFFCHFGFRYSSCCDTGGAIGMPGVEPWYGCAPAWCFSGDEDDAIVNVYVTPWPDVKHKTGVADRDESWERIKTAMECLFSRR